MLKTGKVAIALLLLLVSLPVDRDTRAQTNSRTFPETGRTVRGTFLRYWDTHGGLPQQGYPISDEMQERSDTDGKTYTVQYFERAVFEMHPEKAPPYDVLLSLLGNFYYKQRYPNGAAGQQPDTSADSVRFPETGKRMGGKFLEYWNTHGGLPQQGFPISEEFQERSDLDGKMYRVQYFERAVFEYHPENQPPHDVLLSQLGTFRYRAKYGAQSPTPTVAPTNTDTVTLKIVGPETIVFDWGKNRCEDEDYPDVPARVFLDANGKVQLIASHITSRRMIGPDLDHVARDCQESPVMVSHQEADPQRYNDREYIHATYTLDGRIVYALVHNEYLGHTHDNCATGEWPRCWYNSITLATSTNAGASYQHAAPPGHLVASLPFKYTANMAQGGGQFGVFNPSNIVKMGDYFYTVLHMEPYSTQEWGACLMRTKELEKPDSWRAWDGSGFNVQFVNPYLNPAAPAQVHVCKPIARDQIGKMSASLTYNTYLGLFVLVGEEAIQDAQGNRKIGFYYSASRDLINWSRRKLLLEAPMIWSWRSGDPGPVAYPSVLDPSAGAGGASRNFETSGQRAYLYFTRFTEPSNTTPKRNLVRVPVEFSK